MSEKQEVSQASESQGGNTNDMTKRQKVSKRGVYLINKPFQLQWLGEMVGLCLCFMLLTAITCFAYYTYLVPYSMDTVSQKLLVNTLLVGYLTGAGILLYSVIRLSHRTAGPMYRFDQAFREIKEGKLSARIYLRKHDHWQELAQTFNGTIDEIQHRQNNLEEALSELLSAADKVSDSSAEGKALAAAAKQASTLLAENR